MPARGAAAPPRSTLARFGGWVPAGATEEARVSAWCRAAARGRRAAGIVALDGSVPHASAHRRCCSALTVARPTVAHARAPPIALYVCVMGPDPRQSPQGRPSIEKRARMCRSCASPRARTSPTSRRPHSAIQMRSMRPNLRESYLKKIFTPVSASFRPCYGHTAPHRRSCVCTGIRLVRVGRARERARRVERWPSGSRRPVWGRPFGT